MADHVGYIKRELQLFDGLRFEFPQRRTLVNVCAPGRLTSSNANFSAGLRSSLLHRPEQSGWQAGPGTAETPGTYPHLSALGGEQFFQGLLRSFFFFPLLIPAHGKRLDGCAICFSLWSFLYFIFVTLKNTFFLLFFSFPFIPPCSIHSRFSFPTLLFYFSFLESLTRETRFFPFFL